MTVEQEIKLTQQLEQHYQWPDTYMFKFIIPSDDALLKEFKTAFNTKNEIKIKPSKTGKYWSLSVVEVIATTSEVVQKYKSLSHIKGLMSL